MATKDSGRQGCVEVGVRADEDAQHTTSHIQEQVCDSIHHQATVKQRRRGKRVRRQDRRDLEQHVSKLAIC